MTAIIPIMTKDKYDSYVAPNLDQIKNRADAGTTVFADGSTYNAVDGYTSNGAPFRTRDTKPSPVVKRWHMRVETLLNILAATFISVLIASFVIAGIYTFFHQANEDAVRAEINAQDVEVVGDTINEDTVLIRAEDGPTIPCTVHYAMDHDAPKAFISCPQAENVLEVKVPYNDTQAFDFKKYETDSDKNEE